MNGKYLPLKFAFVLLLVALCFASLYGGNGLRLGQDIAGGYSMIFEVQAEDDDTQDLLERVISVLKKRIDPQGLSNLEWRPLKNNRFEVRMPAASEESQQLRNAYLQARDNLLETNVERSEIVALVPLDEQKRKAGIERLARGNGDLAGHIQRLLDAADRLEKADAELAAIDKQIANLPEDQLATEGPRLQASRTQALAARQDLAATYEDRLLAVWKENVNPRKLRSVLKLYDDALASRGETQRKTLLAEFQSQLDELYAAHPARKNLVEQTVAAYKDWSDVKRPLEDPNDLKRLIRKAGVLEFRIAPRDPQAIVDETAPPVPEARIAELRNRIDEDGPEAVLDAGEDYAWFPLADEKDGFSGLILHDYVDGTYILLSNKPGQTLLKASPGAPEWSLKSATASFDNMGAPAVEFGMDDAGAKLFAQLTGNNIKKPMAILLDGEVYSAPTIQSIISASGQITGRFTQEETKELARILASGSLPGRVNPEPVSEVSFGAAIGTMNMQRGYRAAIYGLIAVAVFMLIYYLLCGAIADVALMLNLILVLGAMSLFNAVLTLPGIAGMILTIGMAVDANVLIFERLREEQQRGLPLAQAVKNAYDRAFTAIFDANLTTLLICLFLFVVFDWVGMEEVRGFAITLGLGVTFSMFTALAVSRWIFQALLKFKILTKPLPMLRIVPVTKVNWMSKRYYFWIVSLVFVIAGVGSLIWQGRRILGIEFSSGTQATLVFQDDAMLLANDGQTPAPPNDAIVRQMLLDKAREIIPDAQGHARQDLEKFVATARVETQENPNRVDEFVELYGNADRQVTRQSWQTNNRDEDFFNALNTQADDVLSPEELQQLPQTSYQVTTTVTNAKLIRELANEAFGKSLQRRVPADFQLIKGRELQQAGATTAPDGVTTITPEMREGAMPAFRNDLLDYEGGVMFAIDNVSPALTVTELQSRIRDIRLQPDFGRAAVNPYRVVGLRTAPDAEGYSAFLVLARPADPENVRTETGREQFEQLEREVLTSALQREDPIVVMNFDAAIAGETAQLAIVVVVLSWIGIVLYLWLRFGSVKWGLAAVACLVHDVLIVVGLLAASGWLHRTVVGDALGIASFKIDLAMVAALLTVIGYSVNDTIVIFDRIRENRGKLTEVTGEVINDSINQSLPRTLLTSFTTFLVVFIMYVWGGPSIKAFNFALLAGIAFGTYSSVAVASPLLMGTKQALIAKVTAPEQPAGA
jgi:SecD/SecF fusion protein